MAQKQRGFFFTFLDVALNILVIVGIVVGIRTFLVSPFQVEGSSMLDTLEDKQYIIINKLAYIAGEPQRGDVVVFRPPADSRKYYVKRIIGMPGDEVAIEGGDVYLKTPGDAAFRKIEEEYLNAHNRGSTFRRPGDPNDRSRVVYSVPEGSYFLLGDNRRGSSDSRIFTDPETSKPHPFVPRGDIKGRVWVVVLPITKIHALEPPAYGF